MSETERHPRRWRRPILLMLLLCAAGLAAWHFATRWAPDAGQWPLQGVAVGPDNRPLRWPTLAAQGAGFAYIDAADGRRALDRFYPAEALAARAAGLRVGAIQHYDLCAMASDQAAAFVRTVPRDADALPAVVIISENDRCTRQPTRALLLSELTTYLNQIETHLGKAALIGPSDAIEARYQLGEAIARPLWLARNWRAPDAEAPAWVIWQANNHARVDGAEGPVRRLVAHEAGETEGS